MKKNSRPFRVLVPAFPMVLFSLALMLAQTTLANEETAEGSVATVENGTSSHAVELGEESKGYELEEHEIEEAHATLFPWVVEAVGIVVFFMISRWVPSLPYTAVMFVIGVIMGIGATRAEVSDQLTESVLQWSGINSEVLLLVFLPGLIFRDALNVDFHLFTASLSQLLLFAFPMVLAGTVLTACVGYYVFPYDWSWFFSMMFGSILAATDPIAVAALLKEVGAPPRLFMHISGESMFNDGSAIVFFSIFSKLFLAELGVEGLGEEINVAQGFKMFFRLALGGVAVGIAFAIGLIFILFILDRRLNTENNVVQVAATVTAAYLSFYVSEVVCHMSGVLAVVMCGITTRAFGGGFINCPAMMESFWVLLEHLLNTLLFTLGGVVWGSVISDTDRRESFSGSDWGYLFLLYVLMMLIRFLLLLVFYPITSRIGLGTNWQETWFLGYGGLRGAVGIALAIAIDNSVRSATDDPEILNLTNKLFGMVGGVALCTLVINGLTAGPFLIRLGLAKSTETRVQIVENYKGFLKAKLMDEAAFLLSKPAFSLCSFALIEHHVFFLKDLSNEEKSYIMKKASEHMSQQSTDVDEASDDAVQATRSSIKKRSPSVKFKADDMGLKEMRLLFLEILKAQYEKCLDNGYIDPRLDNGVEYFSLVQSLDFAADEVNRGGPLEDWQYTEFSQFKLARKYTAKISNFVGNIASGQYRGVDHQEEYQETRIDVLRATAFQISHQAARRKLEAGFCAVAHTFREAADKVMEESKKQEQLAQNLLDTVGKDQLKVVVDHFICHVLLNKAAKMVKKHHASGMLKDKEAEHFLEEIDEAIYLTNICYVGHEDE